MEKRISNKERTLIVGVELDSDIFDIDDSMDELDKLVSASGGVVISHVIKKGIQ